MIVRGALGWLLPQERGLADLTQVTLQDFLWSAGRPTRPGRWSRFCGCSATSGTG